MVLLVIYLISQFTYIWFIKRCHYQKQVKIVICTFLFLFLFDQFLVEVYGDYFKEQWYYLEIEKSMISGSVLFAFGFIGSIVHYLYTYIKYRLIKYSD